MRKCIRCNEEMIEDLRMFSTNGYQIDIREKGIFKGSLGKVKCAVCKKCGYIETYVDKDSLEKVDIVKKV